MRTWTGVTLILVILGLAWAGSALSRKVNEKAVSLALGSEAQNIELSGETAEPVRFQLWQEEGWEISSDGQLLLTATPESYTQYKTGTL